jgi:protein-serine/threonine kinase
MTLRWQIVPASSNGVDAVNFRRLDETRSTSLHLEAEAIRAVAGAGVAQTPGGEDGLDADLFGAFSSMTLEHDGDEA